MGLSNYSSTNRSKRSNLETNIVDDKQTQKQTHNRSENQPNQAISGRRNTRNSLSRSLLVETADNDKNTKKLTRQISLRESKLPKSPPPPPKTRTRRRATKNDEAQKDAPKEEPPKERKTARNRTTSDQEVTNTQRLVKRRVTLGPSEIKAIREKSIAKTTPSTNKTAPNKAVKSDKQEVEWKTSSIETVKDRPNHHQTNHVGANNVTEEAKEVRVPGFRITAPIRPGYRLEGTEDTTDDCYLKRHQKYEAEEIRIKRWDMRRQKEEFERNKLLKGRYYSKSNISASNSKTSKSSASSSSSSAPPSADPSNSSLAASDFKPVLGPYGIYYKKFDPLQIDEIHSIQVIQFDPKSIPQPQSESASSVTSQKPSETEVEAEQQTGKKTYHGKKNQHQSTIPDTNLQQPSTTSQNRASPTSQSAPSQPEAAVRRKRARVSSSASYQQENKVSNENTSENLQRPSKPTSKHSTGEKSARGPLNSVTNHLPVRVFESVSNHSVYDDLDLDYMSSSTNSIDDSFTMRLNPHMKRKSLPAALSTNRIVLTGKSMPRKRARLT